MRPPDELGGDVIIVGAQGRIGGLLAAMTKPPYRPIAVTRQGGVVDLGQPGPAAPIVLCVRNDDLAGLLDTIHPSRHRDLVFVQNGLLGPFLAENGLAGCTIGVLYVAVTTPGGPPVPGGCSVFSGPWAARVAGMMLQHGVAAAAVDGATLGREAAVKLGWICALGLLGEVHQASVGAVIDHHGPALSALLQELHPVLVAELGLDLDPAAFAARISAYSARIRHFPARYKERRWRNEALAAAAARRGLALPQHQALLARC